MALLATRGDTQQPAKALRALESPNRSNFLQERSIGDRQDRADMIYVRGGRGAVGSPEVAPVEGDHGGAFATPVGGSRS